MLQELCYESHIIAKSLIRILVPMRVVTVIQNLRECDHIWILGLVELSGE